MKQYVPIKEEADKLPPCFGYPLGLFKLDTTVTPRIPDKNKPTNIEGIYGWLEERVFSRHRPDARRLLNRLNLSEYDAWEIVKKTNGKTHHDNYWITEDISEDYRKEGDFK